jgi:hypothetical protein
MSRMTEKLPHMKALMATFTFYSEQKMYFCFLEYDTV